MYNEQTNAELLIVGFGGHGRSTADLAYACGYRQLVFLDPNAKFAERFLEFPVISELENKNWNCILAAGDNTKRYQQREIIKPSWKLISLVSPLASIGIGAKISPGCFIGHHTHIGPLSTIGISCIINTGSIVEHDCSIGNYSHISVNAAVAGSVKIGDFVMIGAGATVRNSVTITDHVIIGAGATVVSDITKPGIYIGTPAKIYLGSILSNAAQRTNF